MKNGSIFAPAISKQKCSNESKTKRYLSSVGRATDWKSVCPWFDSWRYHKDKDPICVGSLPLQEFAPATMRIPDGISLRTKCGNSFTFCIAQKVTMLRLPVALPCPPAQQPASRAKNSLIHSSICLVSCFAGTPIPISRSVSFICCAR